MSQGSRQRNGHARQSRERGVRFDFQYLSDSLWNIQGDRKERFASWNRFRGTVDMDLGALSGYSNLYFHATALWQGGGNLGTYLGSLTSPSRMSSANTFRLDSWWLEKRWLNERVTARIGAIRISWGILAGSVVLVTVQSAVLFALLRVLHVNSPFARETLVCCRPTPSSCSQRDTSLPKRRPLPCCSFRRLPWQ